MPQFAKPWNGGIFKTERLCVGVSRMSRMSQRLIPKL